MQDHRKIIEDEKKGPTTLEWVFYLLLGLLVMYALYALFKRNKAFSSTHVPSPPPNPNPGHYDGLIGITEEKPEDFRALMRRVKKALTVTEKRVGFEPMNDQVPLDNQLRRMEDEIKTYSMNREVDDLNPIYSDPSYWKRMLHIQKETEPVNLQLAIQRLDAL